MGTAHGTLLCDDRPLRRRVEGLPADDSDAVAVALEQRDRAKADARALEEDLDRWDARHEGLVANLTALLGVLPDIQDGRLPDPAPAGQLLKRAAKALEGMLKNPPPGTTARSRPLRTR